MGKTVYIFSFCAAHLIDAKPEAFWLKAGDQCVANPRGRSSGDCWKINANNFTRDIASGCKGIISADFRLARFHKMFEGYGAALGYMKNPQSPTTFDA